MFTVISNRFQASLQMLAIAWLLSGVLGLVLGILALKVTPICCAALPGVLAECQGD